MTPTSTTAADLLRVRDVTLDLARQVVSVSRRQGGPWMALLAVLTAADPLRAEPRVRVPLTTLRLPECP